MAEDATGVPAKCCYIQYDLSPFERTIAQKGTARAGGTINELRRGFLTRNPTESEQPRQ